MHGRHLFGGACHHSKSDLFEKIEEALRELLTTFISSNLTTMFTDVNEKTGTIAQQVGQTPQGWNGSIFAMIQGLSQTVIVPIAGMIITFVLCYELISMVTERNNLHDTDTWMFFKWVFKAFVAVYLVTNTFNITMAIFDVGQRLVSAAAGVIGGNTSLDVAGTITTLETSMETMELGELLQLAMETMLVSMCMKIISILITVVLYGRMIFCNTDEQRMGTGRKQLCQRADCSGFPGLLHHGDRRYLLRAGQFHDRSGGYPFGTVLYCRIHGDPLFCAVQNRFG